MSCSPEFSSQKLPEKSCFSQTCSLLRQFLKEKGSLGDLSLGMMTATTNVNDANKGTFEMQQSAAPAMNLFPPSGKGGDGLSSNKLPLPTPSMTTMDLFPQKTSHGPASSLNKDSETGQMTIFYAGQVIVFDDLPTDKAKEIMLFASQQNQNNFLAPDGGKDQSSSSATPNPAGTSTGISGICPTSSDAPKFGNDLIPENPPRQTILRDLPIQRKASLRKFLERRKDRINKRAPYQINSPSAVSSKAVEAENSLDQKKGPSAFSSMPAESENTSFVGMEMDLLSNLNR